MIYPGIIKRPKVAGEKISSPKLLSPAILGLLIIPGYIIPLIVSLSYKYIGNIVNFKKSAQCESCELSFIWGKMRTAAQETASQIALRNYLKEARGKVSIYEIMVRVEYMQSSTYSFRRFLLVL